MDPAVPTPVLYTAIAGLVAAIAFLYRHHENSVTDWRKERVSIYEELAEIKKAINRLVLADLMRLIVNKAAAPELKDSAQAMIDEIRPK